MSADILAILNKEEFTREELVLLLSAGPEDSKLIFDKAAQVKSKFLGDKVYFRGLIELSNQCAKNCFYCGIRRGNKGVARYAVTDKEVMEAVQYAIDHRFGSIVLQSGERTDKRFISRVTVLLRAIKSFSSGQLGITLSMGEQTEDTYRAWFDAGAHRYLLRIETSNRELYYRLHPMDKKHDYDVRLEAIKSLRRVGYNVGTGVMIGLPFQTLDDLAGDLMFFRDWDIDMIGMGPYIEHEDTPLYQFRDQLMPIRARFELSLKMVAILRILMKDINMAATTAMQTIDPKGREKALNAGANIVMPNLTPLKYREGYLLYKDKPGLNEQAEQTHRKFEQQILAAGCQIGYGEWGDSKHFAARQNKE